MINQFQKTTQSQKQIFKQYQLNSLSMLSDSYTDLAHRLKVEEEKNPYLTVTSNRTNQNLDWITEDESGLTKSKLLHDFNLEAKSNKLKYFGAIVIDNLDGHGILSDYHHLIKQFPQQQQLINKAINIVQNIGPTGIAARSVSECLLLQLKHKNNYPKNTDTIIKYYLADLANHNFKKIYTNLSISKDDLFKAVCFIKSLRPGIEINTDINNKIIMPELFICYSHKKILTHLIEENQFNLDFKAPSYSTNDTETLKFIKKQQTQVKNLQKNYQRRQDTLLLIGQTIAEQQEIFFATKGKSFAPLNESQIALKTNLNVSTISRTVRSKYFQCDFGIFPLSILFSSKINNYSQKNILNMLKKIILNENNKHPLTDDEIKNKLLKSNITVSRRTISKYRKKLGIGNCYQRQKNYFLI
ncbi:RNA polymerase subunit sigma-54 [Lactobacillus gasseri]|jgi:RNA polymerase sigma-54 factor|uniref:RNA polymerase factor sigma-54 n=1 Tax=Lactobacillus gasseri TaxID=1596 RepID=UPI001F58365E|nr:RNA polymerase subunit sigma-54 [Lactobacillus gasseri]UNL43693.1 RNA polymerase subunit sigma-54 [Lactobacillus gasseri]